MVREVRLGIGRGGAAGCEMARGFKWDRFTPSNPWNVSKHEHATADVLIAAKRRAAAKRKAAAEVKAAKQKRKWKRWKRKAPHQRKRGQPEITQCVFGVADDSGPRLITASKVRHIEVK